MSPFRFILFYVLCSLLRFECSSPEIERDAQILFDRNQFNEAESVLRSISSHSCHSLVLLGRTRANLGDLKEAEKLYRLCIDDIDESFEFAHSALAKLLIHQSRFSEASGSIDRAIELNPSNGEYLRIAARVSVALGDYVKADKMLERSLELDSSNAYLWFDLGARSAAKGLSDDAHFQFSTAKRLNPSLDMAVVGKIYLGIQQFEHAASAFDEAIKHGNKTGEELSDILFTYGITLEMLRDNVLAADSYRQAIKADANNKKAHLHLAKVLSGTGVLNAASLYACGLNTDEVLYHFTQALPLEEAQSALDHCKKELKSAEMWSERARVVTNDTNLQTGPSDGKKEKISTKISKFLDGKLGNKGYKDIPRISIESGIQFYNDYVIKNLPVVITNFQKDFAPHEDWSWNNLSNRFGESLVKVSVSENGRFDGPESGELWGYPGEEILVRPVETTMHFKDYVKLMEANITETFYIEYQAVDQYLGGKVGSMIPLPKEIFDTPLELLVSNLWISKGGTTAVLHYDDYENLLCQIRGTKELTLFPPNDMGRLYYIARRKGLLEYEYPGIFNRKEIAGSKKAVFSSSVNLNQPDYVKHPLFKGLKPYKVVLQPGEVLYLPVFWHHEVRSYGDNSSPSSNIAVNFWFKNVTWFEREDEFLATPVKTAEL